MAKNTTTRVLLGLSVVLALSLAVQYIGRQRTEAAAQRWEDSVTVTLQYAAGQTALANAASVRADAAHGQWVDEHRKRLNADAALARDFASLPPVPVAVPDTCKPWADRVRADSVALADATVALDAAHDAEAAAYSEAEARKEEVAGLRAANDALTKQLNARPKPKKSINLAGIPFSVGPGVAFTYSGGKIVAQPALSVHIPIRLHFKIPFIG